MQEREKEEVGKMGKTKKRCGEEDGVREHTKWGRRGKERKGKERQWHFALFSLSRPNVALLDSLEKSSRG